MHVNSDSLLSSEISSKSHNAEMSGQILLTFIFTGRTRRTDLSDSLALSSLHYLRLCNACASESFRVTDDRELSQGTAYISLH
jgi:hypothetical protein